MEKKKNERKREQKMLSHFFLFFFVPFFSIELERSDNREERKKHHNIHTIKESWYHTRWDDEVFLSCYFQLWFLFITQPSRTQYTTKFSMVFVLSLPHSLSISRFYFFLISFFGAGWWLGGLGKNSSFYLLALTESRQAVSQSASQPVNTHTHRKVSEMMRNVLECFPCQQYGM